VAARLLSSPLFADVAELVDAHGSGPCGGNSVEVRVLSSASAHGNRRVCNEAQPNEQWSTSTPHEGAAWSPIRDRMLEEHGQHHVCAYCVECCQIHVQVKRAPATCYASPSYLARKFCGRWPI
jgi:hypothetical protein